MKSLFAVLVAALGLAGCVAVPVYPEAAPGPGYYYYAPPPVSFGFGYRYDGPRHRYYR